MRRLLPAAIVASLLAVPAQAIPVRAFVARWQAVMKLGQMAQLDPELRRLGEEVGTIVQQYRIDADRAKAQGKPIGCLPPPGQAQLNSDSLLAYLVALPPAQQELELKDALYAYLGKTYPCG